MNVHNNYNNIMYYVPTYIVMVINIITDYVTLFID